MTPRALGTVVFVAGLATPKSDVARARDIFEWEAAKGPAFIRVVAVLVVSLGAFLAFAVAPARRAA